LLVWALKENSGVDVKPSNNTAEFLGLGLSANLADDQRVTQINWRQHPFNRWSLQRVQQLARTARAPHPRQASALPQALRDIGNVPFTSKDGTQSNFNDMVERSWTDGIVVIHRGQIVHEQYCNGMAQDSLHILFSCSKSVLSTLAGILASRGDLQLDRKVEDILPEMEATAIAGATVQDLLNMRVGVDFTDQYEDADEQGRSWWISGGWYPPEPGYDGPSDILSFARTLTASDGDHADVYHYRSVLTDILGLCIARVAGESVQDLFARLVWQPLGAEHDLLTIVDSEGSATACGGFNCCLRDFGRFAWMFANGGSVEGRQVVPQSWIDACRFPDKEMYEAFARSEYAEMFPEFAYQNKWWVRSGGQGIINAFGIHGQTMYVDPDRDFAVAKFSSQPEPVNENHFWDQILAFEAVAEQLQK
jgi:CubicO group peptidase (beta-lactamase class C family)